MPVVGVVGDAAPRPSSGICAIRSGDGLVHGDADRVAAAPRGQVGHHLLVPEGRVGAHAGSRRSAPARRTRAISSCDEAQRAAPRAGRALAQADVQHLAGARAGGEQRVVAALAGVAEAGALLLVAVHLADEASRCRSPGARRPGPRRPTRRARSTRPAPGRAGARARSVNERRKVPSVEGAIARWPSIASVRPGAQDVAVVDRVGPRRHRVQQREHLAPRPARRRAARPGRPSRRPAARARAGRPACSSAAARRWRPAARRRTRPPPSRAARRPGTVHHVSDLLTPGRGCSISAAFCLLRRSFSCASRTDQDRPLGRGRDGRCSAAPRADPSVRY